MVFGQLDNGISRARPAVRVGFLDRSSLVEVLRQDDVDGRGDDDDDDARLRNGSCQRRGMSATYAMLH